MLIKIEEAKLLFVALGLIGILLLASPALALFIEPPSSQQFSQIYLLGENHKLDNFPFNVKAGGQYFVFLGVVNNMESSSYYTLKVKLASETEQPHPMSGQASSLPSLFEYRTFLPVGQTFESPLTFKVNSAKIANNICTLSDVSINGVDIQVNKETLWSVNNTGYYYHLLVELWLFNSSTGAMRYDDRFVSLTLNMTA